MTGAKEPRTGAPTYDLQSNAEFQPRKPLIYIANVKPLVKPFLLYCVSTGIRGAIHYAYVQQLKLITKYFRQVKRYAEAGWKGGMATTVQGLCFSYGRELYCYKSHGAQ